MNPTTSINLGSADRLTVLYSFPNSPAVKNTLAETIGHWFGQTLERDGLAAQGAKAGVRVSGKNYFLDLTGPAALNASFAAYAKRLPQFLANGWAAASTVVPTLKSTGKWDPCPDLPAASYLPWRFFLPHGMPMLNQKALLFFHYPPIRLLETNQDYLNDPVPVRCEELLTANGVPAGDLMLFNTVMDATPIGAEDDQGSKNPAQCKADGCPATAYDPDFGLIPIQYFPDYQKAQVSLLLNPSPTKGYTAPIVIYGAHPLATFNALYGTTLKTYQTTVVANILPGLKTPVLASSHPYVFYGKAQGFDKIGSGQLTDVKDATAQMLQDLAVARWLKAMSDDPTQASLDVWNASVAYWSSAAQAAAVSALVQHQGSLWYYNLPALDFKFKVPLAPTAAAKPAVAAKPAAALAKPAAVAAKPTDTKPAASVSAKAAGSGLKVIGDSGQPVDWWFIYKISQLSKSTTKQKATGQEYLYFDSTMAATPGAKPGMSQNLIDKSGALFDTFSQLFTPAARANKDLGWYCYNDEDRLQPPTKAKPKGGGGTGPSICGHCKGALAFDLSSNTAFWLIHSVPLLPMTAAFVYPPSGFTEAQTMLCIQLSDADAAKAIAQLMFDAHGPNVHVASDLLKTAFNPANNFKAPVSNILAKLGADDPRVKLMQNTNGSAGSKAQPYPGDVPNPGQLPITSKGGQKFIAIAKNRAWGNPAFKQPRLDFYNVLVGNALNENIEVETWEKAAGKIPVRTDQGETHPVRHAGAVNLAPLGFPWSWPETADHAKLAISDPDNPPDLSHWVCVGDINFTDSMEKRGGGTVGFICDPLWQALSQVLVTGSGEPSVKSGAKSTKSASKPPVRPAPTGPKARATTKTVINFTSTKSTSPRQAKAASKAKV